MRRRTVIISALAVVALAGAVAGALLASSGGSGNGGGSSAPGHLLVGAQHPAGGHRQRPGHSGQHYDVSSGLSAPQMCGLRTAPGTYQHVIVIFMENNSYNTILGSTSTPYIHSLASSCGSATNYHNITHPSLPEYMAATTGASLAELAPYLSDQPPSVANEWMGDNIFHQLTVAGRGWKSYDESMPSNCYTTNSGLYAPRHNPAVYDTDLSNCAQRDIPLGTTSDSPLLKNFSSEKTAPAYAWITPNLCDDMHGVKPTCTTGLLKTGDNWLSMWIPKLTSTAVYQKHDTVIFLTWDEGGDVGSYGSGENCAANASDESCHVVMIVIGPSVKKGVKVGTPFDHYSLLKSSEDLLGLPELDQAASAASMVTPFNL